MKKLTIFFVTSLLTFGTANANIIKKDLTDYNSFGKMSISLMEAKELYLINKEKEADKKADKKTEETKKDLKNFEILNLFN